MLSCFIGTASIVHSQPAGTVLSCEPGAVSVDVTPKTRFKWVTAAIVFLEPDEGSRVSIEVGPTRNGTE